MSADAGSPADGSSPLPVLVCATANPGKVAEIADLLDGVVTLLPRPDSVAGVVEDAGTLVGNARLKARAICAAAGLPALADDTGLEVDALGGAPGVETAHFAGPDCSDAENRARLVRELSHVTDPSQRTARFRTVMMVVWPDGRELVVEGVCEGSIATTERGERGFGYDALFVPSDGAGDGDRDGAGHGDRDGDGAGDRDRDGDRDRVGRTFAEMPLADKQQVSHRARALRALLSALPAALSA